MIVSLTTPPFIAAIGLIHKALHRGVKLVSALASGAGNARAESLSIPEDRPIGLPRCRNARSPFVELRADTPQASRHRDSKLGKGLILPRRRSPPEWPEIDALGLRGRFVVLYLGNTGYGHSFDTVLEAATSYATNLSRSFSSAAGSVGERST